MDGTHYDLIVMGTGITESILSGLLSAEKNKVLNLDRNDYYGDSCGSLNLTKIWNHFKPGEE
jgi:Rab GDP dissociation inhibitor